MASSKVLIDSTPDSYDMGTHPTTIKVHVTYKNKMKSAWIAGIDDEKEQDKQAVRMFKKLLKELRES